MRIALAQLNYHIGNFGLNTGRIIESIRKAKKEGADLIIFAELAVSGYPPRDFLEFGDFIDKCNDAINTIATECTGISAIIGAPIINPSSHGKGLYNTAYLLADGGIRSMHHKSLLPNYDVFDEYRYFEPNRNFRCASINGMKAAITICEDLWNTGNDPLYTISPMDELIKDAPQMIINIAASPFHYGQAEARKKILAENAVKYGLPVFYVNHIGGQTELIFDGGSMALSPDGSIFGELEYFKEDLRIFDFDKVVAGQKQKKSMESLSVTERIHDALVMGIRDFFSKMGFSKAILGLSGGIDSAVTLVLAASALGTENVRAVLLPSRFSSGHSVTDAQRLAKTLGCAHDTISIEETFRAMENTMEPYFLEHTFDLTEENIQARLRAVILMAFANKFGYILLNTSNKSEAAVGYGTLYGDMCGGLSVLGDVYKTQIYDLAQFINRSREIIPAGTITKAPSAELRPDQKDTDSLPEYHILDKILFEYIEQHKGPRELIKSGFEEEMVHRVLRMVNTTEYKRYQTPPILRVSSKAFGMGRRMPIVAHYKS